MERRSHVYSLAWAVVVSTSALAASSCTNDADQAIQLRFANNFSPTSLQGKLYQDFCDDIEERTNGQVAITYYPGATLFSGTDTVDGVKNGIADIGYMTTGHNPGRFPVSEALTSTNGYPSAYVVAHVAQDFYERYQPQEWNGFKVLLGAGHSPMVIFSTRPVDTLDDYAGTKTRVRGIQSEQARLLGASPVSIPTEDSFDALSKGVIDSSTTSLEAAKTWRIAEVCRYCTLTWQVFSPPGYYLIMNRGRWDSLPDDVKRIFEQVSAEYVEKSALMCNEVDVLGADYGREMGMTFINLSDEQVARWREKVAPVTEGYVQGMIQKGFPEDEVRGWIAYLEERTDYWLKRQAERDIKSPMGPPEIRR